MADAAYGLWPLVILNTALFVLFAISFFHPRGRRDWRAMGAFTAFLVALFKPFAPGVSPLRRWVCSTPWSSVGWAGWPTSDSRRSMTGRGWC